MKNTFIYSYFKAVNNGFLLRVQNRKLCETNHGG